MTNPTAKDATQLLDRIQAGPIHTGWHWLGYNFAPATPGFVSVGAPTCVALADVDAVMPGFAAEQLTRLEGMGGREKGPGHYGQIVSWYAELLVTAHLAKYRWPAPVTFEMEPISGDANMNPEFVVELDGVGTLGIEVKAPNLAAHRELRRSNTWQLNARVPVVFDGGVTLPRDNPMKDFLVSADKKFAGFKAIDRTERQGSIELPWAPNALLGRHQADALACKRQVRSRLLGERLDAVGSLLVKPCECGMSNSQFM